MSDQPLDHNANVDPDEGPELTIENVNAMKDAAEQQNGAMIRQLQIMGHGINPLMFVQCQIQALEDFVFGDSLARAQYDTACHLRVNQRLKDALAKLTGVEMQTSEAGPEPTND